jgi:hypothetical protein
MTEINRSVFSNTENRIKLGSLTKSTNSNTFTNSTTVRKDVYGNIISKKVKSHKICFADQIQNSSKKLVEVKTVHSFRNFNKLKDLDEGAWACKIF